MTLARQSGLKRLDPKQSVVGSSSEPGARAQSILFRLSFRFFSEGGYGRKKINKQGGGEEGEIGGKRARVDKMCGGSCFRLRS